MKQYCKQDSLEYRQGYLDGLNNCEKSFCKQIIEMIDNGFITNIQDVKEAMESSILKHPNELYIL